MNYLNNILRNAYKKFLSKFQDCIFLVSKGERVSVFFVFVILAVALSNFQLIRVWFHQLDSTFLMEVLSSIRETGIQTTYLAASSANVIGTLTLNAGDLCKADLIPSGRSINMLTVHAYLILYPLALLTWFFPPHAVLAVVNGISFVAIIYIIYWAIRKQNIPVVGSIVFCALVVAHPAWSHASMGQFYSDRFFMPLGLLYAVLLYDALGRQVNRSNLLFILGVGLLAASTTERAAIMIAMFTVALLVLFKSSITNIKTRIVLITFAIGLILYVFLYVKFMFVYYPGGGSLSRMIQQIPGFFSRIQNPVYADLVKEFLVINVLLFGVFSIFNWRLGLIAFAVLLPNLFTTIGGSEKTGWATHYHSMYFPFLVFSAAMGFSRLWHLLSTVKYRLVLIGLLVALIPVISSFSLGYRGQQGAVMRLYNFYVDGSKSYEKQRLIQMHKIAAAIPEGVKVTTPEGGMPILYRNRTIYYYPLGINTADYALLNKVSQPDGTFYYSGVTSYVGGEFEKNMCLNERLKGAGFNLDKPKLLIGSMAVLERSKP
jgi:hypothetical protein